MKPNNGSILTRFVQNHELHCRILQNTHFLVEHCTEKMHRQNTLHEQLKSIDHLQERQDELHTIIIDSQNQQNHIQHGLHVVEDYTSQLFDEVNRHQDQLAQYANDMKTPSFEWNTIKAKTDDLSTTMTAQATVSEIHEDRLNHNQLSIKHLEARVSALCEKQNTFTETFDADLNARSAWSSECMSRLHDCERKLNATQEKHQAVLECLEKHKNNNKWLCIYMVVMGLLLYQNNCFNTF